MAFGARLDKLGYSPSQLDGVSLQDENIMRAYGADIIQQASDILGMCQQSVSTAKTIFQRLLSKVSLVELDVRLAALTVTFIAHKTHETRWTTPSHTIVRAFTQVLASRGETLHSLSSLDVKQQLYAAEVRVLELLSFSVGGTVTLQERVEEVFRTVPASQTTSAILRQAELLAAASLRTNLPAACTSETLAVGVVYVAGQRLGSPLPADLLPSLNVSEQEILLIAHELSLMHTIQRPRFINFQKRLAGTPPSDQSSSGTWRGLAPHAAKPQGSFWMPSAAPGSPKGHLFVSGAALFGANDTDFNRSKSRSPSPALMQGPQRVTAFVVAPTKSVGERLCSADQQGHVSQQMAPQGTKARPSNRQDLPNSRHLPHIAALAAQETSATVTGASRAHPTVRGQGVHTMGHIAAQPAVEVYSRPSSRWDAERSSMHPGSSDPRARHTEVDCSRGGKRQKRKSGPAFSPRQDAKRFTIYERHSSGEEWLKRQDYTIRSYSKDTRRSKTMKGHSTESRHDGRMMTGQDRRSPRASQSSKDVSNSSLRESSLAGRGRPRESRPAYVASDFAGSDAREGAKVFQERSGSKRSRSDSFDQGRACMDGHRADKRGRWGH